MRAISGCRILSESGWLEGHAIVLDGDVISAIVREDNVASDCAIVRLDGGYLAPGFIDLQVNGGGGVLFNDAPCGETLATISAAHRRFGSTGLLPTLISDTPQIIEEAMSAVDQAISDEMPGILGIHIEGPVLNEQKKGVHDGSRFRELDATFIDLLSSLKNGATLVTLAPERVAPGQIRELVQRGVTVWAGHTDADYETLGRAIEEGLSGFTHLYNAMSPLQSRAPGAVGAALDFDQTYAGIIADGHHVHDAALRVAIKCKGETHTVLVTDAMPSVGAPSSFKGFDLFGHWVDASGPRLSIEAGNLAGSSLSMVAAVTHAVENLNVSLEAALRMASLSAAHAIGIQRTRGSIAPGKQADIIHVDENGRVARSWVDGAELSAASP